MQQQLVTAEAERDAHIAFTNALTCDSFKRTERNDEKAFPAMRLSVAILTLSLFAPTVSVSAQNAARPPLTNDGVI